jgi:toxin YoeB
LGNFAKSSALSRKKGKAGKPSAPRGRVAVFQPEFVEDLRFWVKNNRKVALRALDLVEAILRDPFVGIGKPEPLKYLPSGTWSRRLTEEHRIVYLVSERRIDFLQARYHY